MAPALKRRKVRSQQSPSPTFDDDEPLGEVGNDECAPDDDVPMTFGRESTKSTPWDDLPWKSVTLPSVAGVSWGDAESGGLLGLDELDGDVYEVIKSGKNQMVETRPNTDINDQVKSPALDDAEENSIQVDEISIGDDTEKRVWKEERKLAKKARQAAARVAKSSTLDDENDEAGPLDKPASTNRTRSKDSEEKLLSTRFSLASTLQEDSQELPSDKVAKKPFNLASMKAWTALAHPPHSHLLQALHTLKFLTPTPIQKSVLSIESLRDVVAVAETGSGKTLAYSIPFLSSLLNNKNESKSNDADLVKITIDALIVAPTRELCLQIREALTTLLSHIPSDNTTKTSKNTSGIHVTVICGGLAAQKQRRLLTLASSSTLAMGSVVVATPGRLWDLVSEWDDLASAVRQCKWLVLDEADRLVEKGRFEELERILRLLRRRKSEEFHDEWGNNDTDGEENDQLRTIVASATMDTSLAKNLSKSKWKSQNRSIEGKHSALEAVLEKVDFRDEDPIVVDLAPDDHVASGVTEYKIQCLSKEKDLWLYHFLLRYPTRTLVFSSSISLIRRLIPLLTLLFPTRPVLGLHSSMAQPRRLSSLDTFRKSDKAIMLATDVAARGLDVQGIECVVHYQVPRTGEGYVHRSGRTARAGRKGVVLVMIGPDEVGSWKALLKRLGREDRHLTPPLNMSANKKLEDRLGLAKEIDRLEHNASKADHDEAWTKQAAQELGVDMDDTDDNDGDGRKRSKKVTKGERATAKVIRSQLLDLLARPVIVQGVRRGQFLSSDQAVLDTLMQDNRHGEFVGVEAVGILQESAGVKRKR